jgi:uncharacterized protein
MAREQSVLADTSGIIALLDRDDRHHTAAIQTIQAATILVPSTVLPEVDYLVSKYLGEPVARAFLEDLIAGCFTYLTIELEDIQHAVEIMMQYNVVPLGLVDASLIAVAERYQIQHILTLDRKHFSLIKPKKLRYLELLP